MAARSRRASGTIPARLRSSGNSPPPPTAARFCRCTCSARKPVMPMLRRTFLALAPASALLSRAAPQRTLVRVSLSRLLTMSPFYAAYEAGYFRDAGLDVELTKDLPGVQSLPLIAGGRIDVGFIGLSPGFVNAVLRGARLKIV